MRCVAPVRIRTVLRCPPRFDAASAWRASRGRRRTARAKGDCGHCANSLRATPGVAVPRRSIAPLRRASCPLVRPSASTTRPRHRLVVSAASIVAACVCRRTRRRPRPRCCGRPRHALGATASSHRHFSWYTTVAALLAGCLASRVNHASRTYNAAPSIYARAPVHSAAVSATCLLATFPTVPQYWRATPTDCFPCLGKLVASRITTPRGRGSRRGAAAKSPTSILRRVTVVVLEGLIGARVVDTFPHCADRLPATVAQQSQQISSKGAALRDGHATGAARLIGEKTCRASASSRSATRPLRARRVSSRRSKRLRAGAATRRANTRTG